jgi:hypothetical protein
MLCGLNVDTAKSKCRCSETSNGQKNDERHETKVSTKKKQKRIQVGHRKKGAPNENTNNMKTSNSHPAIAILE